MGKPSWLQWVLQRAGLDKEIEHKAVASPSLIQQNHQLVEQIFGFNEHLLYVLNLLKPHAHDPAAAAEIRRLSGYRHLLIEFAGMVSSDEGDMLGENVFQQADRWIDEVLLEARRNNVDADTFEGYVQLKRNLAQRVVEPLGLRMSF